MGGKWQAGREKEGEAETLRSQHLPVCRAARASRVVGEVFDLPLAGLEEPGAPRLGQGGPREGLLVRGAGKGGWRVGCRQEQRVRGSLAEQGGSTKWCTGQ